MINKTFPNLASHSSTSEFSASELSSTPQRLQIYNEIDFIESLKIAKEKGYKLTISSEKNADDDLITSNYNYIQIENKMNKILEINIKEEYTIVESGVTWVELLIELDKYNYTILSCQSGLTFSIGGSFCGNVHGKKTKTPMVKDSVIQFEYINGLGRKIKVTNNEYIFNAFPGSLGLLGFITNLKIKIQKKYGIITKIKTLPFNNESLNYINNLSKDTNISMLNFKCSHFEKIQEILLTVFYYQNCIELEEINISLFNEHIKIYYTLIVIIFWAMSKTEIFDELRWNIEKNTILSLYNPNCINVNNSFDTWTKVYINKFKIIEFFFPMESFIYCQKTMMRIFSNNNMNILSSGSRIIFEQQTLPNSFSEFNTSVLSTPLSLQKNPGFLRFSQYASKEKPYISLVVNFIEDENRMDNITNEIREHIIKKNIKLTYHTTYSWNFKKEDIEFMFPEIKNFFLIKLRNDPYNLFSNKFSEKYL